MPQSLCIFPPSPKKYPVELLVEPLPTNGEFLTDLLSPECHCAVALEQGKDNSNNIYVQIVCGD